MRTAILILLASCGAPECDRTSHQLPGFQCYPEEVGQTRCSLNSREVLQCQANPPERFAWVRTGSEC